jgi:hypothetical protein
MGAACIVAGIYRCAESQDIARIIELGAENVRNERYKNQLVHDPIALRLFVGSVLADENSRAIVYDYEDRVEGIFAFSTMPNFYYFGGELTANMVIWSVAKRFRGLVSLKLLSYAQKEAKKMGVKRMIMTGPDESFKHLAEHCGYEFLESAFMVKF